MALDYAKCAKEIYENLGGRSNLVSAAHCATRLRLVTVDNSKIDMKRLENIDGVKGVFSNNGHRDRRTGDLHGKRQQKA